MFSDGILVGVLADRFGDPFDVARRSIEDSRPVRDGASLYFAEADDSIQVPMIAVTAYQRTTGVALHHGYAHATTRYITAGNHFDNRTVTSSTPTLLGSQK